METAKFEHITSLGGNCTVAAALGKHGFRETTGPFDWYVSDFKGVLEMLCTNFKDFLNKDNLIKNEEELQFRDAKYHFTFPHDLKKSLEEEYEDIKCKYDKRIQRFNEMILEKTCFIRYVLNEKELDYIYNNQSDIDGIIKEKNPENEIIYILNRGKIKQFQSDMYPFWLIVHKELVGIEYFRCTFDSNPKLLSYLSENYSNVKRRDNLLFDTKKYQDFEVQKEILLNRIEKNRFDFETPIIIYGAGAVGKLSYDRISDKGKVLCFVDELIEESEYCGKPIIKIKELEAYPYSCAMIIVTTISGFDLIDVKLRKVLKKEIFKIEPITNILDTIEH